jgi:hypothetical protein
MTMLAFHDIIFPQWPICIQTTLQSPSRSSRACSPHHLLKALVSKPSHNSFPYSSSRAIFPSLFHQIVDSMIIPEESPFFIPGGRLGLAASGGSTFNVNRTTFSMTANEPGSELPWSEIASTEMFVIRLLNPLFCWYQASLEALTILRAI